MKKGLIIASIASVTTVSAGLAFAVAHANRGIRFEAVKAGTKTFTYNASVGAGQFDGEDFMSIVERSVVTGVSSNIETSVSLLEGSTQRQKSFGSNGNFVQTSGGLTAPAFSIEIGLNNITSVTVVYGLYTTSAYTTADQVGCVINVYDGEGNIDGNSSVGSGNLNKDAELTWEKEVGETRVADHMIIDVLVPSGFIHYTDPLFIKSITVNWSC